MTIGERVRSLRGRKSLAELGKELEVSATQLSKIETDQSKPSIDLATKICELYDVSLDWLYGRTEYKTTQDSKQQPAEPASNMMYVSKDEFIRLQAYALDKERSEKEELQKRLHLLANDSGDRKQ